MSNDVEGVKIIRSRNVTASNAEMVMVQGVEVRRLVVIQLLARRQQTGGIRSSRRARRWRQSGRKICGARCRAIMSTSGAFGR